MLNVLRQVASGAGIMAVGMLFVILTRGIDLSVGSVSALGSVLSAYFITVSGFGPATSILLVMLSGAACGLVTGAFVAYLRLPSFVMSLAMMAIARGLSLNHFSLPFFQPASRSCCPSSGQPLAWISAPATCSGCRSR